jgi:hypothetical protein
MRKKTPRGDRESALASGWTVEGDKPVAHELVTDDRATAGVSTENGNPVGLTNGVIVLLGAFGGLYLLYAWGWFIVAQAYSTVNSYTAAGSGIVGGVLQQIIFWAAPFAPVAWLITAILLTRGRGSGRLALALIVGAIVLVPVPMLVLGVVS